MNSELELLRKYDVRVFKTFCRDIIYKCIKYDETKIVAVLKNTRMMNFIIDKKLGKKVFNAKEVLLSILKQGNQHKYYLIIDENKIELELGKLEKNLIQKEIHKFMGKGGFVRV